MSLTAIIIIILIGIFLLLIEILAIPGVSIAGIGGFICMIAGIVLSYKFLGIKQGNIILLITFLVNVVVIIYSLRTKTWKRIGLASEIKGKANLIDSELNIGDVGKTISRLAPSGKAMFKDKIVEVHSDGVFVDQNTEIFIRKIKDNKIFIKTN
ncbi:MAG: NfeD family protein [Bacteroidales bacterium]|nr:NfeD family protein [Bacteroidales bacterium]